MRFARSLRASGLATRFSVKSAAKPAAGRAAGSSTRSTGRWTLPRALTAGARWLLSRSTDHIAVGICEMSPLGKRYWATRGGGAYVSEGARDARLHVSGTADLAAARGFVPPALGVR